MHTKGEKATEFVTPTAIDDDGSNGIQMADGDVVIFANFRADRARQLTSALTDTSFSAFERTRTINFGAFVTMTDYGEQYDLPVAYPNTELPNTFGALIERHRLPPTSNRRDRKICPRDVFLQWRQGTII